MNRRLILEITGESPVLSRVDLYTGLLTAARQLADAPEIHHPITAMPEHTILSGAGQDIGWWKIVASPRFSIPTLTLDALRTELERLLARLGLSLNDAAHAMIDDMVLDLAFDLEANDLALVTKTRASELGAEEER